MLCAPSQLIAAGGADVNLEKGKWSFAGPFGYFDKAALQRGFQVYREVCAGCHGIDYLAFRNLADLGYNAAEIKAIAAEYEVMDGPDDDGEMFMRPARPADQIPNPYRNDNEAIAGRSGSRRSVSSRKRIVRASTTSRRPSRLRPMPVISLIASVA